MSDQASIEQGSGETPAFNIRSALELDRKSLPGRLFFAAIFAAVSLLILPWPYAAAWLATLLAWEAINFPLSDRIVRLPHDLGMNLYAACNVVGGFLYNAVALGGLATDSPLGIAIGATWLCGSFMNCFIYAGENRKLLWSVLAPGIAIAIVGPMLHSGPSVGGAVIGGLILTALVAARSFSIDHQVLLQRLADKQGALADVERKLSLAVEASGDGLFEVDLLAGTSQVSANWMAMLGYGPDETHSPDLLDYTHPDDRGRLQQEYAAHFGGETQYATSELRLRCKDGSYKWVLSRGRLVSRTLDGQPWRLVGTTIDISARKALEHQLESALDVAERAKAAMSMFVANMSHEIRTPLNGVIGVAGALARTSLAPTQRDMVDLMQSSAQILDRLLCDILDQSKLEAGELELQIAPFDLRVTVEAAAELMRQRAEDKGLALQISYSEPANGLFEGDAVRLRQIVSNLASNAIKFTDSGSVRIAVDAVDDVSASAPTLVTICVTDTGIGFDADTAHRLFARFVQADGSISRRFGGTGLGLAISKALTERMGGVISATSTPGAGSVFTVELPFRRAVTLVEHLQLDGAAGGETQEPLESLAGLRILLAEDHPTNREVVRLILGATGVHLTMVEDGEQAVEAYDRGSFDLILMDMQMPRMDGLAATREIRRRERAAGAPPTPIAMITANAMDEHRVMAADAGATHHIAKPINPERLFAGIAAAVAARPGQAVVSELSDETREARRA